VTIQFKGATRFLCPWGVAQGPTSLAPPRKTWQAGASNGASQLLICLRRQNIRIYNVARISTLEFNPQKADHRPWRTFPHKRISTLIAYN